MNGRSYDLAGPKNSKEALKMLPKEKDVSREEKELHRLRDSGLGWVVPKKTPPRPSSDEEEEGEQGGRGDGRVCPHSHHAARCVKACMKSCLLIRVSRHQCLNV